MANGAARAAAAVAAAAVTQGQLTDAELQAWRTDFEARLQTGTHLLERAPQLTNLIHAFCLKRMIEIALRDGCNEALQPVDIGLCIEWDSKPFLRNRIVEDVVSALLREVFLLER